MIDFRAYEKFSDPIFRVSLSLIFIIGGLGHFGRHEMMLQRVETSPWFDLVSSLGQPSFFLYLSGIVFCIAGVGLMLGLFTRLSALALFLTLIPITFVIHIAPDHTGPLFKNVAILGGLVHFMVRGGGWCSLSKYSH
ncbi:DoxX family protein [Halieaceae bacterium IMCC8485]|uniref:DoxX family protein n=1 Tax=Candidatus Seongchinamella marina TaxID=2518990 RepID=A0ABT3SZU9_9GAMM|nr:DoxX family protein [Candidatus Seongchinamella marina]MCX2975517.1 DoxX family protein [Candidatus Seongchinamella marina]